MGFGWTANSLIPTHPVSAIWPVAQTTTPSTPAAQTFTPQSVPQINTQPQLNQILAKIMGPNFTLGANPSPIAGSGALYSPNYLAQVKAGTAPNAGPAGFTQFGNSFWKMPPQAPNNSTPIPGVGSAAFAPAATSSGVPSGWVPNSTNLFNI